ncbi:MAG: hypothetical protein HFJ25_06415 [Clostridia bacterium]|nr:hypothetical protein [Clostridia bacterium]
MVYNYKEIIEIYGNDYNLKKALSKNEIFKLDKGIYSNKKIVSPLVIYSKKYPNSVITMDSAYYYYNLTDVIPSKVYLATDRNADKINNEKIVQTFMAKNILYQGRVNLQTNDGVINIYDRERLLIELIRKKKKIPFDYYKEIISNYRALVDELDMYKIEEYLALFKNDMSLSNILQMEVF